MPKVHNIHKLASRRKELRKNQTPQEDKLWWCLKDKRLGIKFRRQHSVGGYILDFYCSKKKLIIELDGKIHASKEAREYDEIRDKYFEELGYTVLRFTNLEVENDIKEILNRIKLYL